MATPRRQHRRDTAASTAVVFATVLGLWFLWSGHFSFEHPLLIVLGTASAGLVTLLCWRMGICDSEATPVRWLARSLGYIPWLATQTVRSSLGVLRRGLGPRLEIDPVVVVLRASQESDLGLVTYANSITLTPGTLSIDSDAEARTITVHAVAEAGAENLQRGEMDRHVRRLEGRR